MYKQETVSNSFDSRIRGDYSRGIGQAECWRLLEVYKKYAQILSWCYSYQKGSTKYWLIFILKDNRNDCKIDLI